MNEDGDGDNPQKDYERWKRWSRAYLTVQKAKGVPEEAFGSLLYTLLDGTALRTFDSIPMDQIEDPGGHDLVFQVLDERFPEEATHDRLGKVLDAVFDLKVEKGETTSTNTGKARAAFAAAEAEGVKFPAVARGYLLLRLAKLPQEKKAVVMAAARQSYEEKDVAAALRTTYPEGLYQSGRQTTSVHVAEETSEVNDEEEDDGDLEVLLAEYGEDEPIEEQDAIDVLMTWKQTRSTINKEKIARGFGSGGNFKKLEARVKCFKCKQIGHFSRNCPKRGKGSDSHHHHQGGQKGGASTKVNYVFMVHRTPGDSEESGLPDNPSTEEEATGQLEEVMQCWEQKTRDYWKCQGDTVIREHVLPRTTLFTPASSRCPVPISELSVARRTITIRTDGSREEVFSPNWKARFEAHRVLDYEWTGQTIFYRIQSHDVDPTASTPMELAMEEAESSAEEEESVVALVHEAGFGVVDTGCGRGIVGEETLAKHQVRLRQHGLEIQELEARPHTFRYGNGSSDVSTRRVQIPVIIRGKRMQMRAHVVPGKVPLLISKRFLKGLGAKIDMEANEVFFNKAAVTADLLEQKDGSYQINLIDTEVARMVTSPEVDVLQAEESVLSVACSDENEGSHTNNLENDMTAIQNRENATGVAETESSNQTDEPQDWEMINPEEESEEAAEEEPTVCVQSE